MSANMTSRFNILTKLNRPNTAVIYVRVSSEEQTHGYSLGDQEKACRIHAAREKIEAVKLFREEGESGKTADRTAMLQMQEYIRLHPGKIGYIIVHKTDRFSRNMLDHAMLRKSFKDYGVELKSATEPIDETPYGRFFEHMLSGMANLDNDIRTERTVMGMRSKALDGYWPWKAPWGYKNVKDKLERKIIVFDAEKAVVVKYLFGEFSRGTVSLLELASAVNRTSSVKSRHGRQMTMSLVHKILKNPIHCGRIEVPKWGISVAGKHEPIISVELFEEVQRIMQGGTSRKQPRNRNNPEFPLRGVECGHCGGHISGGYTKGRGKRYAYYGCCSKKQDCPNKQAIKKIELENSFTEFLRLYTPEPVLLDALAEAIRIVHEKESKFGRRNTVRLKSKIIKLEQELEQLLQFRLDREIENRDFLIESDKRRILKRELELEVKKLCQPKADTQSAVEFGLRMLRELPVTWEMLEPGELKALRAVLFPENLRYTYPGFQTAKLSPVFKLKAESGDDKNRLVTLTMQNSKPIIQFLQSLSAVAGKFASLQNRDSVPMALLQETLP